MYKYIWFALLLFVVNSVKCQNVVEFEGNFRLSKYELYSKSKAEYHYYEDEEYNRILHDGFFADGEYYLVSGNYYHGKKDGLWKMSSENREVAEISRSPLKIYKTNVSGNFHNGELDGKWEYENVILIKNFPLFGDRSPYYDSLPGDTEISKVSFDNGIFIDEFYYFTTFNPNDPLSEGFVVKIAGEFTDSGFPEGIWTIRKGSTLDVVKYNNGTAYWRLKRDTVSGEKLIYESSQEFVERFWENYDMYAKVSVVDSVVYYPDTLDYRSRNVGKKGENNISSFPYSTGVDLWSYNEIMAYGVRTVPNPIYYPYSGSRYPWCYEISIRNCYDLPDNKYCNEKYDKIEKEIEKRNRLIKKNQDLGEKYSKYNQKIKKLSELSEFVIELEDLVQVGLSDKKEIYLLNHNRIIEYFSININEEIVKLQEISIPNDLEIKDGWSEKKNKFVEEIENGENEILLLRKKLVKCQHYLNVVKKAINENDRKILKILKSDDNIDSILESIIS